MKKMKREKNGENANIRGKDIKRETKNNVIRNKKKERKKIPSSVHGCAWEAKAKLTGSRKGRYNGC